MPEFKVFTKINVPYSKVWEKVSTVGEIEKWSPVKFTSVAEDVSIQNGLRLKQKTKQLGVFGVNDMEVIDAFTNSKVRRQYSFADVLDKNRFNRITYMFDDNSITTMMDLCEDQETKEILEEKAKTEPAFQVDVMAHVYYTYGSTFWRSIAEVVFIKPFFTMIFRPRVTKSLAKLKAICEQD